jgi:hypothetical protein
MIVLIIITAGFNMVINGSYGPLLHSLPLTLAHKSHGMPREPELPSSSEPEVGSDDEVDVRRLNDDAKDGKSKGKAQLPPVPRAPPPVTGPGDGFDKARRMEAEGDEDDVRALEQPKKLPTDFNHPASVEPQRIIWLPHDTLGIGEEEVMAMRQVGIEASTEDASMDAKGKIAIDGAPPGL